MRLPPCPLPLSCARLPVATACRHSEGPPGSHLSSCRDAWLPCEACAALGSVRCARPRLRPTRRAPRAAPASGGARRVVPRGVAAANLAIPSLPAAGVGWRPRHSLVLRKRVQSREGVCARAAAARIRAARLPPRALRRARRRPCASLSDADVRGEAGRRRRGRCVAASASRRRCAAPPAAPAGERAPPGARLRAAGARPLSSTNATVAWAWRWGVARCRRGASAHGACHAGWLGCWALAAAVRRYQGASPPHRGAPRCTRRQVGREGGRVARGEGRCEWRAAAGGRSSRPALRPLLRGTARRLMGFGGGTAARVAQQRSRRVLPGRVRAVV